MADYDYDIGIIGGGAAGLTVASGAAQLGAKTLLVEKEKALGGDCLYYGCVPSKTLIKTAYVYHLMKNGPQFGLPAVSPPPVDFREVSSRISSVIGVIQKHDSVERFCKLGAKVEFGDPVFTDEHAIDLGGKSISARTWVIATGSSSEAPPIKGLDKTPYLTNRDIFYLDKLPASMIVLGGGPVAVEIAQAFCRLGTKVTVVQRSSQILSKEDRDMADIGMNEKRAQKAGIDYSVWSEEFNGNDRALAEGESVGRIKLLLDSKEKPLGVQILGPHAGDLVSEWVAIMNGGVGLSKIASAIHPYPTLGEINKKVTGSVFSPKIFSDTVRKGLKFFFSFKGRACSCGEDVTCGEVRK